MPADDIGKLYGNIYVTRLTSQKVTLPVVNATGECYGG